jgi:hypothetical protein
MTTLRDMFLTRYDVFYQSTGNTKRVVRGRVFAWVVTRLDGHLDYVRAGDGWV